MEGGTVGSHSKCLTLTLFTRTSKAPGDSKQEPPLGSILQRHSVVQVLLQLGIDAKLGRTTMGFLPPVVSSSTEARFKHELLW